MQEERREIRCGHCGKLLAKGQATSLEFKCPRCGAYTIVRAERPNTAGRRASPVEDLWPSNADTTTHRA